MALLASLSPEQLFSLCRAFRHPLRRSEDANFWRQRLASQVPIWIALDANFAGVRANVFAELFHQERMHDVRLVMRHAFLEELVEAERMTGGAGVCEFHRRHQFAPVHG